MSEDLLCEERLSEGSLEELVLAYLGEKYDFNELVESMARNLPTNENDELLKYPQSLDSWKCCGERWTRYSHVIDHIEHNHYLYRREVINNSGDGLIQAPAYKYECDNCEQKYFSFFAAITHFLRDHVEHRIFCFQCCVLHTIEYYHEHIHECNIIESYVRSNQQ